MEIRNPTSLIKSQEEAIHFAQSHKQHDHSSITFYTDGSKSSKGVGAAYRSIKNKDVVESDKMKLHRDNTIFQAEATVLLECLLFIKTLDCVISTIFYDSQSVLKSLTSFNTDPLITLIQNIYSILSATRSIDPHWCPGHINIYGNECADRLAKAAVEHGRQPSVPYKLPLSHAKLKLKRHTLELWQKSWDNSTNSRLTHDFIPNLRRNPIAHINLHYKSTAVITGHGTFNMYR